MIEAFCLFEICILSICYNLFLYYFKGKFSCFTALILLTLLTWRTPTWRRLILDCQNMILFRLILLILSFAFETVTIIDYFTYIFWLIDLLC